MLKSTKVSLLMDESELRSQLISALQGAGFEIQVAPNAETADRSAQIFILGQRQAEKISPTTTAGTDHVIRVGAIELHTLRYDAFCQGKKNGSNPL